MEINLNVNKDFERCLEDLKKKYGEDFEYINGVHPSQLDFSEFIDNFVSKDTLADVSVDPNANANNRDIRSFMTEKGKSEDKLFALSKIFSTIKKQWGLRTAKQWLEQEFSKGLYLNDSATASYFPYCWANDLTRLANEGLFFLKNYNNQAPQHLTTYFDDVIEFVSFLSNRQSGAVGLPNVLIWAYYFWKKDVETGYYMKDPEYYLRQQYQKFIFRLNQPFLRIDQSSFTNVSIFDRCYLEALFGGVEFPDGTFAIDQIEEIIQSQKVFMEVVSEIREENMFTYPVLTFSLLYINGKFQDEEFARWASAHNIKWSDSNFFVSDNVGVLSNCCFDGSQMTLTKSSDGVNLMSFEDIYNAPRKLHKRNFTIFHNGNWVKGKVIRLPIRPMYKITTANNKELIMTDNHLSATLRGDISTSNLTTDDWLMFSTKVLNCPKETDKHLTYEQGFLIGMYLGDGSMYNEDNSKTTTINLSLNKNKYQNSIETIKKSIKRLGSNAIVHLSNPYNNVYPVTIRDNTVALFIREYVSGKYCFEKELNMNCLLQSVQFRQGILDGYYLTDGGNSNRIYSTSKTLIDNIECLCVSLGIPTIVNVEDRTGEDMITIRGQNFNRNYPVYCIRWYHGTKRIQSNIYKWVNNSIYFKIKNIEPYESASSWCYCFEMENNEEPYFTLPNGVITHNCRLLSDTQELDPFINSIGGTALSVGSCRVSTINFARIAYESKFNKKKYLEILRDRTILDCKALYSMRHILRRNIEKGLLPNYQEGAVEFDKQFCTIGGIGVYETMDMFNLILTDELGNKSYSEEAIQFTTEILNTINEIKDNFIKEHNCDFKFNLEMIPAENCAGVMATANNLIYEDNRYFILSNQWIPLMEKCTIQEKCRLGSKFDKLCGGGCIAHINVEGRFPNEQSAWDMLNYVASQGVIYFAFTTKISVCEDKHAFIGTKTCPKCGKPIADTYSRVVGFYTPVSSYQKIRKKEWNNRQWYNIAGKDSII